MRLWVRSFIGVLAALTVVGLARPAPLPPTDPTAAAGTSAITPAVAVNAPQPNVSERAASHVRILPSRPAGMVAVPSAVGVADFAVLIGIGRGLIDDAGHDWRSLLLGAPPAPR